MVRLPITMSLMPLRRCIIWSFKRQSPRMWKTEKIRAFQAQLDNPDHVLIEGTQARIQFGLSESDLKSLTAVKKENPFDANFPEYHQYHLPDIVKLARFKHSADMKLLTRYAQYLDVGDCKSSGQLNFGGEHIKKRQASFSFLRIRREPPPLLPSIGDTSGLRSIETGLLSNVAILTTKCVVFSMSGSSAVFADLSHSAADVLNYSYRWWTVSRSCRKPADLLRPYGYDRMRDVCADRSFFVLLNVGGIMPLLFAAKDFFSGLLSISPVFPALPVGMLAVTAYLEGVALVAATKEIRSLSMRSHTSFTEYILSGRDIMPVATFLEASTGLLGAMIGSMGLVAAFYFHNPFFDIMASGLMSVSIIAVSGFLLTRSQSALLGMTLPIGIVRNLTSIIENQPTIVAVYDVKSEVIGTETMRFKAEIEFNAEAISKNRLNFNNEDSLVAEKLLNTFMSIKTANDAEDWLMRNDSGFLLALTIEIKRIENLLKDELRKEGYNSIHIDLEPW